MIEILLEAERALTVGMLDQAERLYRQAADNDPRNAIAVVGLARVALERSDEQAAITLGHRALAIDPDNATARRLVDRLVEVRAYRGDPPLVPDSTVVTTDAAPSPDPAAGAADAPPAPPAPDPPAAAPADPPASDPPPATPADPPARPGFLRRLLGRR
jgi:tetratricopeptide (TPR) repeat protein